MEKDGQNKKKTSRELYNLESYIKQGKYPCEIYKKNIVSLSRSTIFERCKRYKEDSSFERKSNSGIKPSILTSIFDILNLINTNLNITRTQIKQ